MSNMIGTAGISGDFNYDLAYKSTFGALPNKTAFYNPSVKHDMRENLKSKFEAGVKALSPTTGGAGTASTSALVPIYVDPRIVDQSRKFTPLVEMLPRVTNQGLTADYNVITSKGGAYTANADASLPESDDTYDRKSKSIKYLYSVGRVLGPSQASVPQYMLAGFQGSGSGMGEGGFSDQNAPNAKQLEVLVKARAMKELEENLIINGDSSSDATEFDGIVAQQGTTNQLDKSSEALSWGDIEEAIRYAFDDGGRPKIAVASSTVVEDIRKIMVDTFNFRPQDILADSLAFGVPSAIQIHTMVGPVIVIPSMYLSNTTGAKQIYFLDTDYIEMRVLQDMTYEELAKTNDSSKFMIKIYECLVMRAPQFNAFIDNIA